MIRGWEERGPHSLPVQVGRDHVPQPISQLSNIPFPLQGLVNFPFQNPFRLTVAPSCHCLGALHLALLGSLNPAHTFV